jgi:hypothetical protein
MSENPGSPEAEPPVDPWLVERLLADPAGAADGDEQALATLLAALRSPADPQELAEQDHYLAAFASAQTLRTTPPRSRRKSMLATLLAARTVVAGAALATVAAATAAAAYTGSLPSTLQDVAHRSVGAPAAEPSRTASAPAGQKVGARPTPTSAAGRPTSTFTASATKDGGPSLGGPAAAGLCNAFTKGGLKSTSTAHRALAEAAGGASSIPAYCATVLQDKAKATSKEHRTGKPSSHATGKPSAPPAGPGEHPTKKALKPTKAPKR